MKSNDFFTALLRGDDGESKLTASALETYLNDLVPVMVSKDVITVIEVTDEHSPKFNITFQSNNGNYVIHSIAQCE